MNEFDLEQKLSDLRIAYKNAKTEGERKLIVTRANYLKKLFAEENQPAEPVATPEDAEKIFNEHSL